jgi:hypothetical protein
MMVTRTGHPFVFDLDAQIFRCAGTGDHRLFCGAAFDRLHLFHARHLYITAQWQPRDHVFRFAALESKCFGTQPDGKARHFDVDHLGRDEVAELMHEDENAEDNDGG